MPSFTSTSRALTARAPCQNSLSTRAASTPVFVVDLPASCAPAHWELTGPAAGVAAALQRENITHLCTTMMWLRSWWDSHQDAVRAIDRKAAAEVHDHFIDGAIFARGTARGMKLDLDEQRIRNYRWGNSAQSLRLVIAMPAAAEGRTA